MTRAVRALHQIRGYTRSAAEEFPVATVEHRSRISTSLRCKSGSKSCSGEREGRAEALIGDLRGWNGPPDRWVHARVLHPGLNGPEPPLESLQPSPGWALRESASSGRFVWGSHK